MPESNEELVKLNKFINGEVSSVIKDLKEVCDSYKVKDGFRFLGIGGTITSVSAINQKLESYSMEKIHASFVSFDELKIQIEKISRMNLLGIGGTITSVSAINQKLESYSMEKIHASFVSFDELKIQIEKISRMNLDERRQIKGLQAKRAEIILSGELILKSVMDNLSLDRIQISEFDNLEGIILEDMSKFNK